MWSLTGSELDTETQSVSENTVTESLRPNMRRRQLARLLRARREARGLRQAEVARRMRVAVSTYLRWEVAEHTMSAAQLEMLFRILGIDGEQEQQRMHELCEESRRRGWYASYHTAMDVVFRAFVGLEDEADLLSDYAGMAVPGILQTRDYAVSLMQAEGLLDGTALARQVELRQQRQKILERPGPLQVVAVLDESVLHRMIGSRLVMKAQLRHLRNLSEWPNITIQILPFMSGAVAGPNHGFTLLEFFDDPPMEVVYVENDLGSAIHEDDAVARYRLRFDAVRDAALSEEDSRTVIEKIAK